MSLLVATIFVTGQTPFPGTAASNSHAFCVNNEGCAQARPSLFCEMAAC